MKRLMLLTLLLPWPLGAQKFYEDDPLQEMPDPIRVEEAAYRKLNDYYDLFQNTIGKPGERQPKKKGTSGQFIPAQAVNSLGEVPDSAWFTNRIGSREISYIEVARGAGNQDAPASEGPWTIVGAKTEGVTPGFEIRDSKNRNYLLKFDPLTNPEMATGADVIGAAVFHALGYNVPENYLVTFAADKLVLGKNVILTDSRGKRRSMSKRDVKKALLKLPRNSQGRIRGVASLLLPGKILGEFRYHGTRMDDHNDIVPHEHRRDLRGLFVFCAWLNHSDSRAINTLDTLVERNGLKYVRHHLIDFGSMLGSASVVPNTARDGNSYFYELKPTLAQIVTLGIYVPRWARASYVRHPALGTIEYPSFEPEQWKPNYPNPAFANRLPDDEFWAAKKVMAFSDRHIHTVVKLANYSDPKAEDLMTDYLIKRRDQIGRTYFAKVLPLDDFRIEAGKLKFDDLEIQHGFIEERAYKVRWSEFNNSTGNHTPIPSATDLYLPKQLRNAGPGSYFSVEVWSEDDRKTVTVYFQRTANVPKLVGVERKQPWRP